MNAIMKKTAWALLVCCWAVLFGACGSSPESPSADGQPEPAETPAPAPSATVEAPPAETPHALHCEPDETVVFSCGLEASGKVVSICASTPLARDQGYLQYRFGRIGDIELTFAEDRQNTQEQFLWQTVGYSGGWDTRIQFSNGGYRYQLYDQAFKVSMSEKALHGGIIILKDEATVAHLKCDAATLGTPYSNTLNDLYEKIPDGVFFEE